MSRASGRTCRRRFRAVQNGHVDGLDDIEARLDALTTRLLVPLRTDKVLDGTVMADLLRVGDELRTALDGQDVAPKRLVGKCWFIFTAMLTEADHARAREPILDAAWEWAERLRLTFGPNF